MAEKHNKALEEGMAANDALKSNIGADDMKNAGQIDIDATASEYESIVFCCIYDMNFF